MLSSLPTATSSTDRSAVCSYDGLGHLVDVEAVMPTGTPSQTTQYNYGVTTSGGSAIDSNDLLASVQYPDKTGGSPGTGSGDEQAYTYNAIGQQISFGDQNGSTHSYSYDLLGRRTADAVAVASGNPQNVDTSLLLQTMNFDTGGRSYQITQYNAASGGSVVNQVQYAYNGLGQLTNEYQEHGGAVNTGTSLQVQYGWNLMASGVNNSNLLTMTYPNGRVLHYGYNNTTLDSTVSRIDYLADDNGSGAAGTHLEDYSFLGQGVVVQRAHPQSGVNLTYIQQSGDSLYNNDGGDQYTGLDRFGRVIDQFWLSSSATTDRFQYAYDNDGNALYKNNLAISSLSELYHPNSGTSGDNNSAYDNLHRLDGFIRGTLSASTNNGSSGLGSLDTVSTASSLSQHSQSWSLDTLGNWSSQTVDGTATSRTHNSKNELTVVGSNNLTFDNNGNTTTVQTGNTYTFDAWNRPVTVKNAGGTTIAAYVYDACGRRVKETHSSTTSDVYFTTKWQVIEERQGSTVTNQYVWSQSYIDALILRDDNSTSGSLGISGSGLGRQLYPQYDANWNTTALVDTSGTVQERFVYDPYGNVQALNSAGSSTTDSYNWMYLHQGGRLDSTVNLYDFQHRSYNQLLGRWMTPEPRGALYVDGLNLYQDEASNPIDLLDPTGLTGGQGPYPPYKQKCCPPAAQQQQDYLACRAAVDQSIAQDTANVNAQYQQNLAKLQFALALALNQCAIRTAWIQDPIRREVAYDICSVPVYEVYGDARGDLWASLGYQYAGLKAAQELGYAHCADLYPCHTGLGFGM